MATRSIVSMCLRIWTSLKRAIATRYPAQLSACTSSWEFSLMIEITSTWQWRVRSMPCIWTATFSCVFLSMKHFFQDWTNEHPIPVIWHLGHLALWHLAPWTFGHWTFGTLDIWHFGHLAPWTFGSLDVWPFLYLDCRYGRIGPLPCNEILKYC